MKHDLVKVKLT